MKDNTRNNSSEVDVNDATVNEQEKRRKAVKNILMAGGSAFTAGKLASTEWTKPMIESVVLPAHARTSNLGFSITDPVSLSYTCSGFEVRVDITGYIDQPIAGINVRLELSWSGPSITDSSTPRIINVLTNDSGIYSETDVGIGWGVDTVSVIASLPDFPTAGTDSDSMTVTNSGGSDYYCVETTPPPSTT